MDIDERLARAVLLFYREKRWTVHAQAAWRELTGFDECTTRALGRLAQELLNEKRKSDDGSE